MDIREYIESGTLEAFVLGALSAEEAARVQADIAMYPELAAEVAAIETAMHEFALHEALTPPGNMEDKIWNAIQASQPDAHDETSGHRSIPTAGRINFTPQYKTRWNQAAVWALLVGSVALNTIFWFQNSRQKEAFEQQTARIDRLSNDQKNLQALLAEYHKNKDMMADTAMQTIVMRTAQKGHPMAATLYWSKDKGEAYVSMDALPEPPKGMQYQLWVMQNGKPVDMGILPLDMASTPAIKKVDMRVASGEAFAISLEKEGGSPTPTMQNIYVMGKPA